jgi:hypothetical protein
MQVTMIFQVLKHTKAKQYHRLMTVWIRIPGHSAHFHISEHWSESNICFHKMLSYTIFQCGISSTFPNLWYSLPCHVPTVLANNAYK